MSQGEELRARGLGVAALGCLIGTWGSMCGIGGGLFAVPLLHYVYHVPLKRAVVMSLSLVFATTSSSTVSEIVREDSALEWGIVGGLVLGALFGAPLGFRVAQKIDTRRLKMIFIFVLAFVGLRILGLLPDILSGDGGGAIAVDVGWTEYLVAIGIGFGGGFVAPLLGIGGGLVAVPGLHLAVPIIGHLGARACSLAMGTVASGRSLRLYFKSGQLDLRASASLALGAVVGAWIGVQLVHLEGLTDVAEKMLGITLLGVAARFTFDVRKSNP
jgi:uncharacterized protein